MVFAVELVTFRIVKDAGMGHFLGAGSFGCMLEGKVIGLSVQLLAKSDFLIVCATISLMPMIVVHHSKVWGI